MRFHPIFRIQFDVRIDSIHFFLITNNAVMKRNLPNRNIRGFMSHLFSRNPLERTDNR